jgi:hypothetical protein
MLGLTLRVVKRDLVTALGGLGARGARRRKMALPVWLRFDPGLGALQIGADNASISATIPALGNWPSSGATVGLGLLSRVVDAAPDHVEMILSDDELVIPTMRGRGRLDLLAFGPSPRRRLSREPDGLPVQGAGTARVDNLNRPTTRDIVVCGFDPDVDALFESGVPFFRLRHCACISSRVVISIARIRNRAYVGSITERMFSPLPRTTALRPLAAGSWRGLLDVARSRDFWHLPPTLGLEGLDGWTWEIDGRHLNGSYIKTEEFAPMEGPLHAVGSLMFKLADIQPLFDQP